MVFYSLTPRRLRSALVWAIMALAMRPGFVLVAGPTAGAGLAGLAGRDRSSAAMELVKFYQS